TDLARVERVAHVVLLEFAGAPARDVEELVVHGQREVGDQRRNRTEALQQRRQQLGRGGLGGNGDHLGGRPLAVLLVPQPDRGGQVLDADHPPAEPVPWGRGRR